MCFDPDQKKPKYFFGQGRLFFRAIDHSWSRGIFNMDDGEPCQAEDVTRNPVKI